MLREVRKVEPKVHSVGFASRDARKREQGYATKKARLHTHVTQPAVSGGQSNKRSAYANARSPPSVGEHCSACQGLR